MLRRRRVLALLLGVPAAAALPAGGAFAATYTRARVDTARRVPFDTPLAMWPLDVGTLDEPGRRRFDPTVAAGKIDVGSGRT